MNNMTTEWKFDLGEEVKDVVTGFKGVIIVRSQWLNGCVQYGIKPRVKRDGKLSETEYFDEPRPVGPQLHFHHAEFASTAPGAELRDEEYAEQAVAEAEPVKPFVREAPKVGRNAPCPCGSGKKYKQCHGKIE